MNKNICKLRFLSPAPTFKSKLTPPLGDIDTQFYLISKAPFDPAKSPFNYDLFNRHCHITPDVLWFQPYFNNPSALNCALTLGPLIESGDTDGVTLPLPNIDMSLTENNSMYLQGTRPLSSIQRYPPSDQDLELTFILRKLKKNFIQYCLSPWHTFVDEQSMLYFAHWILCKILFESLK